MNHDLILDAHRLGKGEVRRVRRPLGRRVECLSGVLWVTQDGDRRDVVLEAGVAFVFDRDNADALVSGLAEARYLLLEACPAGVTAAGLSAHRAAAVP